MATDKSKDKALKLALEKIANVNAMDYEYQAWAREALAEQPAQLAWTDKMTIDVPDQELYKAQPAPAQPKYRRGDRLICLETEEYCVIHISGTDRQWVKFPDTHIGVYKNEQLAELFELLPKEIEIEQPAQQEPVAWRDHVEQRLRTWQQSFVNRSGDQLALDDFMDKRSLDDLIDFVCDEYTSPPAQRKPLTDEQIDKLPWGPHEGNPMTFAEGLRDFARAIEAAHGIKENT